MGDTLGDLGSLGDGTRVAGFGGGASDPYMMELMRRRAMADALAKQGMAEAQRPMTHWLQPLGSIVQQGVGAWRQSKADDELLTYAKGQAVADEEERRNIMALVLRRRDGAGATPTPAPQPMAPSQGSGGAPAGGAPASAGNAGFISTMTPHAMEASRATGIDPRLILAQSALETNWGKSAPGNNYFGIKGPGQTLATNEVVNGQNTPTQASFRAYESPSQSFADYAAFLKSNPRYAAVLKAQGLDPQIDAMGASGYATDPQYGQKLRMIARGINVPTQEANAGNMATDAGVPTPAPSAPPVAAPMADGGLDKNQLLAAALVAGLSRRPNTARMGGMLAGVARAIPDPSWTTVNIGGTMFAVNDRDPNQRIPLGASQEHTPLPQIVVDQRRQINAPYQELPRTPERQAQEVELRGPQFMNVAPGNVAIDQSGKPVFTNPAEPPKPDKMRSEFIDLTKDFRTIQDAHAKLTASARMTSAAGDLGVIFGIMKMYDPGSTVREGEQATAANAGGVPDRVRAMWNRALTGERLAPDVRADFVNQADILLGQQRRGYDQTSKVYGDMARRMGIDPALVLPDFITPNGTPGQAAAAPPLPPEEAAMSEESGFFRGSQPRGSAPPRPPRTTPSNPLGLDIPGAR